MDKDLVNKNRHCPLCRELLVLKNDVLFCPSCNIYIGRPESFHISFGPNSHYFHQKFELNHSREKEETVSHVFLSYIIIFIIIVGVLFVSMEYFYKPYVIKIQKQEQVAPAEDN